MQNYRRDFAVVAWVLLLNLISSPAWGQVVLVPAPVTIPITPLVPLPNSAMSNAPPNPDQTAEPSERFYTPKPPTANQTVFYTPMVPIYTLAPAVPVRPPHGVLPNATRVERYYFYDNSEQVAPPRHSTANATNPNPAQQSPRFYSPANNLLDSEEQRFGVVIREYYYFGQETQNRTREPKTQVTLPPLEPMKPVPQDENENSILNRRIAKPPLPKPRDESENQNDNHADSDSEMNSNPSAKTEAALPQTGQSNEPHSLSEGDSATDRVSQAPPDSTGKKAPPPAASTDQPALNELLPNNGAATNKTATSEAKEAEQAETKPEKTPSSTDSPTGPPGANTPTLETPPTTETLEEKNTHEVRGVFESHSDGAPLGGVILLFHHFDGKERDVSAQTEDDGQFVVRLPVGDWEIYKVHPQTQRRVRVDTLQIPLPVEKAGAVTIKG